MDSLLIVGGDSEQRKQRALDLAKENNVFKLDVLILSPNEAGSIGIEEVRNFRNSLFLKSMGGKTKLAIILNFEKATSVAQNAFLKTLEEPPDHTIIVLTSPNADLLLPTIISRCQVIQLTNKQSLRPTGLQELEVIGKQLEVAAGGSVGERLLLAETVGKTREEVTATLSDLIIAAREIMIDSITNARGSQTILNPALIKALQKTHTLLATTQVNPRLALETLFLNL